MAKAAKMTQPAPKNLLSRDAILALKGGRYEDVKGLGGTVRVAAVSAGARDAFELSLQDMPEKERRKDFRARLLVMSCIDEDGKPLFGPDDIPALSALEAAAVDPVNQPGRVRTRVRAPHRRAEATMVRLLRAIVIFHSRRPDELSRKVR